MELDKKVKIAESFDCEFNELEMSESLSKGYSFIE